MSKSTVILDLDKLNVVDFDGNVRLFNTSAPLVDGTTYVSGVSVDFEPSSGTVSTDLYPGNYRMTLEGQKTATTFTVPATPSTYLLSELLDETPFTGSAPTATPMADGTATAGKVFISDGSIAASTDYVDEAISNIDTSAYVEVAGDTMTGNLGVPNLTFTGTVSGPFVKADSVILSPRGEHIASPSVNQVMVYTDDKAQFGVSVLGGLTIGKYLTFGEQNATTVSEDTIIQRTSAGNLAMLNGSNPQGFHIYNTTAGANYERLSLYWSGNKAFISTPQSGGSSRALRISPLSNLELGSGGNDYWYIPTTGHFLATTDNANDIGASGASRPRDVYVAGKIYGGGVYGGLYATNGTLVNAVSAAGYTQQTFTETTLPSRNVLLRPATSQVICTVSGDYAVDVCCSAKSSAANVIVESELFLNGNPTNLEFHRKFGTSGDVGCASMSAIVTVSAPGTLALHAKTQGGSTNLTYEATQMRVKML